MDPLRGSQYPRHLSLPPADESDDLGNRAVMLADLAGLALDPWQQTALRYMLRRDSSGLAAAFQSLLLVPRQNGKSLTLEAFDLAKLFLSPPGHLILHTAHQFKTAVESFRHLVGLIKNSPDLWAEVERVRSSHGDEGVELKNGSRLLFAARTVSGAGRGFSPDTVIFDEAYRLPHEAAAALMPALSARPDPQAVYASSTGYPDSEILWSLVERGRAGGDDSLCFMEWCADPGADLDDRAQWAQANPAIGYRLTEKKIAAERLAFKDRPDEFARERLGLWSEMRETAAIDLGLWANLADPAAERGPQPVFAVATAPDHSWSAVAVAWRRPDESVQVMLADYRPTTTWVAERVAELRERWRSPVLLDTASRGLVDDGEKLAESAQAEAHNELARMVLAGEVRHGNQPALNTAVRGARWKTTGNTQVLDRKGALDISPLVAAALAVHGLSAERPSVYEERDLVTL